MTAMAEMRSRFRGRSLSAPPWTVTFIDLVVILLAFMVMDFAMRQRNADDWVRFQEAFAGQGLARWLEPSGNRAGGATESRPDEAAALDLSYLFAVLGGHGDGAQIALNEGAASLEIALPDTWLRRGAALTPQGEAGLRELAGRLSQASNPLVVIVPESARPGLGYALAKQIASALSAGGYLNPIGHMVERGGSPAVRLVIRPQSPAGAGSL